MRYINLRFTYLLTYTGDLLCQLPEPYPYLVHNLTVVIQFSICCNACKRTYHVFAHRVQYEQVVKVI